MFNKKKSKSSLQSEAGEALQSTATFGGKKSKLGKKKKIIIIASVLVLAVLFLVPGPFGGGGGKGDFQPSANVSTVEKRDIAKTISIKGVIEGSDSAKVYSTANYNIKSVNVKTGDVVREGQILATLDADTLMTEYNKASLSMSEAKRKYDSTKTLYEAGAVSQAEYLTAKTNYDSSVLALNSLDIKNNSNIISPISGTITRVNAAVGKTAAGGTNSNEPLFVIENLDRLQMKIDVGEYDIGSIKEGQRVTISSQILGEQTVEGVVSHIAPTGEQKSSSGGGTEMVIPVVIDVDKGNSALIAGVTAKALIHVEERKGALSVPIDALLEDPETFKSYIFTVVDDGTLTKCEVTVGLDDGFYIEISGADIPEGQKVLLNPTYEHHDGMKVMLDPASQGTAPSDDNSANSVSVSL